MNADELRLRILEYRVDRLIDFMAEFGLKLHAGAQRIRLLQPVDAGGTAPEPPHDPDPMEFLVTVWGAGNAGAAGVLVTVSDPTTGALKGSAYTDGSGVADVKFFGIYNTQYDVTASGTGYVARTIQFRGFGPASQNVTTYVQRDRDMMPAAFNLTMVNSAFDGDKPSDWVLNQTSDTIRKVPDIRAYVGFLGTDVLSGVGWLGDTCIQGYNASHTAHVSRKVRFFLALRAAPVLFPSQPDLWYSGWIMSSAGGTCAEVTGGSVGVFSQNVTSPGPVGTHHFTQAPGGYNIDIS